MLSQRCSIYHESFSTYNVGCGEELDEGLEVDSELVIDLLWQLRIGLGLLQICGLVENFVHDL